MSADLTETHWDTIIVGTGIGGGTLGRALAEAGQKVLFLEKGPRGYRRERQALDPDIFVPEARLVRGYWPEPIEAHVDGRPSRFFAPLGAGLGGSSVFYAATLERPERHDLDDMPDRPHPTGGWPVCFDKMLPWYDRAAKLYALSGGDDPLSDAPPLPLRTSPDMPPGDAAMMAAFERAGLHPYRLNAAIRNVDGCDSCLGRKCPRACKMDGRSAGVEPALATGNAELADRSEARRLLHENGRVSGVETTDGRVFRADRYVLAAGALGTPRLLLGSSCEAWPDGAANGSGLVGRNLMFHLNEMVAIWPPRSARDSGPSKGISLRDFYFHDSHRLGMVQAMGVDVSYGEIVHYLNRMLDHSALGRFASLKQFTRIPAALAAQLFGTAKLFVGLLEDMPYPDNAVQFDPQNPRSIRIRYDISAELRQRRRVFRKALGKALRGQRHVFLNRVPDINFGHPCGTARFGADPAKSVLTPDCRTHEIDNLYVADASFFPTSMGVNPSLTIAANALRVAEGITRKAAQ